ncbi:MAG: hypothetical protein IJV98_06200 [Clostridia bacterium]|nr:hypothetical protein [Clostridia bacterium]
MKKYTSVFGLIARGSFYKILVILCATCIAQLAVYGVSLMMALDAFQENSLAGYTVLPPQMEDGTLLLPWIFGLGLVLTALTLMRFDAENGSKPSYTLMRLQVTARTVLVTRVIYQISVFFLFWMAEIVTLFLAGMIYLHVMPPVYIGDQLLLLTFYTDPFMHGTLPLGDTLLWLRNLILILSLGSCAMRPKASESRLPIFPMLVTLGAAFCWRCDLYDISEAIVVIVSGTCITAFYLESHLGLLSGDGKKGERNETNETASNA